MPTGLPLLSGPPPVPEGRAEIACRKCNKEFNVIFTRSRRCNHCGYAYCHNCTDYQALMPRESGYDSMNVCAFCIEMLQITAAGKGQLKTFPLAKLKKYAAAYDIRIDHAVEKDDVVDVLVAARGPNGCLSPARENFYRTYSVPDRSTRTRTGGLFSRSVPTQPPPPPPRPQRARPEFARPDLAPDDLPPPPPPRNVNTRPQSGNTPPRPPPRPQAAPRPPPRPQSNPYEHYHRAPRPTPGYNPHYPPPQPPHNTRPQQSPYGFPGGSRSSHNLNTPVPPTNSRPRAASSHHPTPPASPPQPTPSLNELVEMPPERIASLSIGVLKSILWQNHVTVGMVLEKGDLVKKVNTLIEDEKRERERVRLAQEREDQERIRLQHEMMEEHQRAQREREEQRRREEEQARRQQEGDQDVEMEDVRATPIPDPADIPLPASPPASSMPKPPPPPPSASSERSGLCVVCQDEDANIAIVDCGCVIFFLSTRSLILVASRHLCLCRSCCDMVMASSRECPLCRTRIVTEARLLRIFKA
ncbi:hypothetical protein VKT23_004372 [Stygiomarasmius scandens]|uniref:FYVE-type domain-containing protein n=1 Tax=Marasmiellus scandens TaxID=2682957 RepID=A0ABR1JX34_9AGAR